MPTKGRTPLSAVDDGDSTRAKPTYQSCDVTEVVSYNVALVFVVVATTHQDHHTRPARNRGIHAREHPVGRVSVYSLVRDADIASALMQQPFELGWPSVRQWQQVSPRRASAQGDNLRLGP